MRNVWKDGIEYAAKKTFDGINPFKMGVVSASDSHTGVMGWHPENEQWPGHLGIDDAYPMADASTIQNGTGGPSVVWAEENTRDSIFEALKRKETYGTSGPRMKVRFFAGWNYPADACGKDFVDIGYKGGVPMGGDLPARTGGAGSPTFITAAIWDDHIKTKLQQIQIIKGWVDEKGNSHERVYTVAGEWPAKRAARSTPRRRSTPTPARPGRTSAASASARSGRTLTSTRASTRSTTCGCSRSRSAATARCGAASGSGVDPLDTSQCNTKLAALQSGNAAQKAKAAQGAMCCSNQTTDTFVQPVIQERAWTSPIWYEPADSSSLAKK